MGQPRRNRYAPKHARVRCFRCRRDFAMGHPPKCPAANALDNRCVADVTDTRYESARRATRGY